MPRLLLTPLRPLRQWSRRCRRDSAQPKGSREKFMGSIPHDHIVDAGIAAAVAALQAEGVETFESCEGGSGHAFPEPTIRFRGMRDEGYRALAIALRSGLPVRALRRSWTIVDGEATGPDWELVFYRNLSRPDPAVLKPSRILPGSLTARKKGRPLKRKGRPSPSKSSTISLDDLKFISPSAVGIRNGQLFDERDVAVRDAQSRLLRFFVLLPRHLERHRQFDLVTEMQRSL